MKVQFTPNIHVATELSYPAVCSQSSQHQVQNEFMPEKKKARNPMWFPKLVLGLIIASVLYNTFIMVMSLTWVIQKGHGHPLADISHELIDAAGE